MGDLWDDLTTPRHRDALRLSLVCSLWATAPVGRCSACPLAWVLARVEFPGRSLVRALVLLPLVLPPVVGGVGAVLRVRAQRRSSASTSTTGSASSSRSRPPGVVMAETFVAMPFLVITVEAALRSMDRRYEDAAATLGAGRWTCSAG